MKILLVSPKNSENWVSFQDVMHLINKKAHLPPLGLLTVAAILPDHWQKKLIDLNVNELKTSDIMWADYIFLGGMYGQRESMRDVAIASKRLGAKIVIGGPYITKAYESNGPFQDGFEELRNADHLFLGEAELTLPEFISDLENGSLKHVYQAVAMPDLKSSPIPLWELINCNDYFRMSIQFSRGCPHECEFCDVPVLFGHNYRTKNTHQVIEEVTSLYNNGWRGSIFIADDNFIFDRQKLKKYLLPEMKRLMNKLNHPFQFSCEATMDLADDPDLMKLLVDTGVTSVFLGIESTNMDSLRECGKIKNIDRNLPESIRIIHNAGLIVYGGFIIGFDHDTEATVANMFNFIQETGIVSFVISVLYALPKTKLYNRLKSEARLLDNNHVDWLDGDTNFEPKMGYDKLKEMYKKIHSDLLQPSHFYYRVTKCLDSYHLENERGIKWTAYKLHILLKIVVKIGFFDNRSKLYRKVFLDLFLRYPKRLEWILSFMIPWHNSINMLSRKSGFSIDFDYKPIPADIYHRSSPAED